MKKILLMISLLILMGCEKEGASIRSMQLLTADNLTVFRLNNLKEKEEILLTSVDEEGNVEIINQYQDSVKFYFYKLNLESKEWEIITESKGCANSEKVIFYYPRYDGYIYLRLSLSGDYAIPDDYFLQAEEYDFQWLLSNEAELKVGEQTPVAYGVFNKEGSRTITEFDSSLLADAEFLDFPIVMCTAEIEIPIYVFK